MTHRFFLPPDAFRPVLSSEGSAPSTVVFPQDVAHQLHKVLRLRPGACVLVLDDRGWVYEVELTDVRGGGAAGRVCGRAKTATEPRVSLVLYQGMLKGQRFEWVLQKGTELGVSVFVPTETRRSVARSTGRWSSKLTRLERILREAAEQSGRGRVPRLADPLGFADACREAAACDLALIPALLELGHRDDLATAGRDAPSTMQDQVGLTEALRALEAPPQSVALLIGSEGGFEAREIALAQQHGIQAATLGPRILRAETAALVAATIVLSELGEMA